MFDRRLYDLQNKKVRTPEEEKEMNEREAFRIKLQEEKDAGWRRMMASRTPEEVAKGVCAPG